MESIKEKLNSGEFVSLFEESGVSFAYIFGSQIGEYSNKNSDIDLAVMLNQELSKNERFDLRLKLMGQISNILKKEVDLIILNDVKSLFFKYTIIKEGKLFYKESEGGVADFESKVLGLYFDFKPFLEEYNKSYVKRNLQQNSN